MNAELRKPEVISVRRLAAAFAALVATAVVLAGVTSTANELARDRNATTAWPVFRGDTVWAVVRDEYDVQRLNRFHLETATAD